ncbi:MAG: HyaD/HybD family hydrogenase maturation endopeptidase [Anaerolineales bacterium]|nr:HyaD/HybD family hydrogenase maturation endopeptidase [Anaerolineales bacterium]
MNKANRKVVLGLGNTLQTDEGLGVHALALLAERLGPQTALELLDGGVLGLNLLPIVESASHLLILDAANANRPPGSLIELRRDEIPLYAGVKMSQHQATFQEVLGLADVRDRLPPHLHLVGAQPADLTVGVGLSATVAAVLPEVVERATAVLRAWRLVNGSW